jgi:asparagine synthase (glutamine-hydrolysing)
MCGIAGIAAWTPVPELRQRVLAMTHQVHHRGPDAAGAWFDDANGVGLGHRRLAIIDLSPAGHQPMASASGRYVLAYNGEVYNFEAIRVELCLAGLAPVWRGHSDTEVLLAAIEAWGVQETLRKAVGMFAIVLWDRRTRTLVLARDRLGEKPLYYGFVSGHLRFASELKALRLGVESDLSIDRESLAEYMRFGYLPAPRSIYRGIFKLPAGHWLSLRSPVEAVSPQPYWSADSVETADLRERLAGRAEAELADELHDRLRDAVALQMVSDVPIGAFLSGGVDSSAVVALMQSQSERRVRTFTIGFEEDAFNEAPYARAVARHLGTDHTELHVSTKLATDLIADLPSIYDEPFADSSQIPTTLVARLTRQHVTVSLSGDGGDELFAGYPRYPTTASVWQRIQRQPPVARAVAAGILGSMSARNWDAVLGWLPAATRGGINGRRIHRVAQLLRARSIGDAYVRLMSHWQPEDRVVLGTPAASAGPLHWAQLGSDVAAMRRWDIAQYLPDDLLVKVDRASMSAGLESRAPFLDHRVVELALALPEHLLVRAGTGKWLLRKLLDRYVPRHLIERPKAGFEIPLGDWLRGALRPWAESLLEPSQIAGAGYLDPVPIARAWQQHLAGTFDRGHLLWNVLMFQAWQRHVSAPSLASDSVDTQATASAASILAA